MEFVKVLCTDDGHETSPHTRMEKPCFYRAGPWVVTPSQNKARPGFAVTYAPDGRLAWPCANSTTPVTIDEAKVMADRLNDAWSGNIVFSAVPDAAQRRIAVIVRSA